MIMKCRLLIIFFLCVEAAAFSQTKTSTDTIRIKSLDSVFITSLLKSENIKPLPAIQGTYIFSGKKSEVLNLQQIDADYSNKIARQVFVKVPGIFVYDMDGTGNQINISARGLDPHRGWEFNIRKDGVITNSDMYGYPASHYSMPLESIDHIELVRGTGSLQYGAQFGGMLNYVTKQGDTTKRFSFESINTAGSYNLLSTYNAIGGKLGKLKYYAYMSRKTRDGYRDNEETKSESQAIILTWEPTANFSIRAEWARAAYTYRIPGPLTDSMFYANPRQATRARSYFNPDIHVPSITLFWNATPSTTVQFTTSAILGNRYSVQFDKPATVGDTINAATLQYNNRQVDIDRFHSYTSELRILQRYAFAGIKNTLAGGIQYMNNDLHRTQLGKGTTGSDYDLTLLDPQWGRDIHFKTKNIALFAENSFHLTDKLSVNVGARVEMGNTHLTGSIVYYPENDIPVNIEHNFPLFGANFSYKPTANMEVYGGWSQAYHPMLLKDLIPGSLYEKVDPNIRDADGYNVEAGFRGRWKFLKWDVTGYLLQYNNRFGTLATDVAGTFYTYRTNIGNSLTKGLEVFLQGEWFLNNKTTLTVFTSTSLMDAAYTNATVKSGNNNLNIRGNQVESAPSVITRNGATLQYRVISISGLYSYTAKTYADALNTVKPSANGAVGLVPAYGILDMNASAKLSRTFELRVNVNNVTNKQYFTKRPMFYPGPGVWSSDGRNFSASLAVRL
jgi:Fe(3+) dicitrate transport protein